MNPLARWWERRRLGREMAAEMAEHLAEKIEQLREDGLSDKDASGVARQQFGNATLILEDSRAAWGWNAVEQFWQDARYGVRVLRKTPAFTATAVVVLGLGIGLNTAMFSAVKAVLLSALPYPEPERMVELRQTARDGHLMNVSGLDFRDWRAQNRTVAAMATYGTDDVTLAGSFPARRARMAAVGTGFFEVAATRAAIGRTFSAEEQKPGGIPTLVFGYELATAMFGNAASAIQKTVRLNGMVFTVIGVMPPKFNFPDSAQVWLPNDLFPDTSTRSAHNYRVVGRLKPGVTVSEAQADMNLVAAHLTKEYVDDKDDGIRVASLFEFMTQGVRSALLVLWGAVTMVLLIACVNISNLFLARAAARRKEMGLRGALGAGRLRLIRQLLTESVLIAGTGGVFGFGLAKVVVKVLRVTAPANIPRLEGLEIDGGVLLFTVGLSLFVGLLFGLLPAVDGSKTDVNETLKQGTGKGQGVAQKRWGGALVIGQVALAIVLLSGAALLIKSYWTLAHEETGMASGGVYITDLTWPAAADGDSVDAKFVQQAGGQTLAQVGALPGVKAAALIAGLPFEGAPDGGFEIEGRPIPADPHERPDATYRMASADYFKALGMPILRGRGFTAEDERGGPPTAIVNQTFEEQFFANDVALGKRIRFFGFDRKPRFLTIVGIVPDVRGFGLKRPVEAEVYANYFQHADTRMDATLVVRGPTSLQPRIERIVTSLNRDTAVNFESMEGLISGTIAQERFQTALLGVFAGCALVMAVVGVYGLLSYVVTRRRSELGLRMALGADSGRIARLVVGEGGLLVLIGVGIGVVGSLVATQVLKSMLYEVKASDPAVLLTVVGVFAAVALAACYVPALRASRIDPADALRAD